MDETRSQDGELTHRVAVAAVIVQQDRILLMHRTTPPRIWAPPGGRLRIQENPLRGLKREVWEECRILIEPMRPIAVWVGEHKGAKLLALPIVCKYIGGKIVMSREHDAFKWVDPSEFKHRSFQINGVPVFGSLVDYLYAVWLLNQIEKESGETDEH